MVAVTGAGPQLEAVRELFLEYARSLGFSLCFQGFDRELATLPGDYAPPSGCLLLALEDGKAAGCVGLRRIDDERCEMKRLYVRPEYRGRGLGRELAEKVVAEARKAGYRSMYLDTLPVMKKAQALYQSLGFSDCAPYYDNSCVGSRCMLREL
jgi:ribosomal protein S18 acetylase RimI-like enzyme